MLLRCCAPVPGGPPVPPTTPCRSSTVISLELPGPIPVPAASSSTAASFFPIKLRCEGCVIASTPAVEAPPALLVRSMPLDGLEDGSDPDSAISTPIACCASPPSAEASFGRVKFEKIWESVVASRSFVTWRIKVPPIIVKKPHASVTLSESDCSNCSEKKDWNGGGRHEMQCPIDQMDIVY